MSLKSSKLGSCPRGQVLGKIPFLPALPRFVKGSWGAGLLVASRLAHPCGGCFPPASLSLDEGVVLGMGPRVVSVTPTEAGLPKVQAAALGSQLHPLHLPRELLTAPIHPLPASGEMSTLPHCLGISPETLSAFCCPYLHLFGFIYPLTSSPHSLSASPSLCQPC